MVAAASHCHMLGQVLCLGPRRAIQAGLSSSHILHPWHVLALAMGWYAPKASGSYWPISTVGRYALVLPCRCGESLAVFGDNDGPLLLLLVRHTL